MDKFFGSAIFEFADRKEDICICLNLLVVGWALAHHVFVAGGKKKGCE